MVLFEETARLFLETSRAEAHVRAQLRDGLMVAFSAAAAAIFGFALANESAKVALVVVPYLAFGVASLLGQHNVAIHALSRYQVDGLRKFLGDGSNQPPLWESSQNLRSWQPRLLILTLTGQIVVLVAPSVFALALVPYHVSGHVFWGTIIGGVLTLLTVALLLYAFVIRFQRP